MTALGTVGPLVATAANRPVALTAANQVQNLAVVAQISWASEDGEAKAYVKSLNKFHPRFVRSNGRKTA